MIKNLLKALTLCVFLGFSVSYIYGGTLITAPIDSRPISTDYLGNLAAINGDVFITAEKDFLDIFPANTAYSRFAESQKVRDDIKQKVSEADKKDTTVIINTSSYMTAGLVGSRCGDNYRDYEKALDDLYLLITKHPNPSYYVNLSMPRTLPETRLNKIWRDDDKINGLAYYYLKYNENSPERNYIATKLARTTPEQIIMEWSYVENKKQELGAKNLTPWETDFLNYFNNVYKTYEPYKTYLGKYIMPYSLVSEIFSKLMKWQQDGLIDEIIISNDDFQLPNSIVYFNNLGENWIPKENGSPIKYSFARTYITNGPRCIYKLIKDSLGEEEVLASLSGKSENINFLFGTDEIPQLIYARDLSKRNNLTSDIKTISTSQNGNVAKFDVLSADNLLKNDINFISASNNKTKKQTHLYLFDYNNKTAGLSEILKQMDAVKKSGNNVGLIELFSSDVSASGENTLFKRLLSNSCEKTDTLGITDLSCYSAWNTNANAIGLGVAHAQVFGISEELSSKKENLSDEPFIKAHIKMLSQHIAEDGIYTVKGKRELTNERFVPVYEDTLKSEKLYNILETEKIISAFKNAEYNLNGKSYKVKNLTLTNYNFPWGRLFECCLDFNAEI